MECGIPFCSWGCPLGNFMPDLNDMVYKGEWKKAFERISLQIISRNLQEGFVQQFVKVHVP